MTQTSLLSFLVVYLSLHTFMVLVYLIGTLGSPLALSCVNKYNALVLGFLNPNIVSSDPKTLLVGFALFVGTGVLSAAVCSTFPFKSAQMPALFSLLVVILFLALLTLLRSSRTSTAITAVLETNAVSGTSKTNAVPGWISYKEIASISTSGSDLARIARKLKSVYHLTEPCVPPYAEGLPAVIPLRGLEPTLLKMVRTVNFGDEQYRYRNLPAHVWKSLRSKGAGQKYLLVWSAHPDEMGRRGVILVDLTSDLFYDRIVTEEQFKELSSQFEPQK